MKIFVFCALGVLVCSLVFAWLITRIRYRIGSRHIKVLLFGLPLRRVAFADVESVSKRRGPGLTENWWSTLHPKHRLLVLRRRRGLFKNFVITPKNRYIFKTEVERGMRRNGAQPSGAEQPQAHSSEVESDAEVDDDSHEIPDVPAERGRA
jgi:hypothetical protein